MCDSCEAPERVLWTYGHVPPLNEVHVGNWMMLMRCPSCEALWLSVPYEPYASFIFVARWPYSCEQWHSVHDLDNGATLHDWHRAVIRESWQSLPEKEQINVQGWRDRTDRQSNPIDRDPDTEPPRQIERAADIEKVIDRIG